jgi:hypothetical protein
MNDDSLLPPLETGWLSETPIADSYLRRFLFNWAGMCTATAESHGGQSLLLPDVHLADAQQPAPFSNCATLLQPLAAETAVTTLAAIASFFAFDDPTRQGEVLLLSIWPTGDLRPYGWSLMGYPPVHLLPKLTEPRPAPEGLRIEEVRDLEGLYAWEQVAIAGYPLEALAGSPSGLLVHESWLAQPQRRMWVGWVDDRTVCASSAWIEHGINDVTLVATIPEARRRGYGEALTWRAAQGDPLLPAMLLSSDDGRPVYERMGFLPLLRITLWYRPRPS